MSSKKIPMYLLDPLTNEIKHEFGSILETSFFLNVTKQAVHDALQKGYRCKGFIVVTQHEHNSKE